MHGITKVHKGGVIKLPAWIKHEIGLKEGDILLVDVQDGRIVLTPQEIVDPIEKLSSELGDVEEDEVFERGIKKARISWRL
ncbi:MAG: AbrB/MazE/SpoVT family DNA-binding domain-containing protein [Candidatus Methanodesulfokora washburnensis]|jgi:AbrB family looped-hinge helix DNA binding protein